MQRLLRKQVEEGLELIHHVQQAARNDCQPHLCSRGLKFWDLWRTLGCEIMPPFLVMEQVAEGPV